MSLTVLADAKQEIDDAAAYYDGVQPGLGRRFLVALNRAIQLAARVPRTFTPVAVPNDPREIRKTFVKKYPYTVYYEVRATGILVLAVSHQSRQPLYWTHRRAP